MATENNINISWYNLNNTTLWWHTVINNYTMDIQNA
jgi:hypothetical protein